MAMTMDVKAKVDELAPSVLSEGDLEYPRLTNIGQLFTADWRNRLILAGKAYRMSIGTISGTTAHTLVGAGTAVLLERPYGIVAVDSGVLIPMGLQLAGISDTDADNDVVDMILTADRAVAVAAGATATVEAPDNLLDGGAAFGGRAWSIATGDIATPVHSDILYYKCWEAYGASLGPTNFSCEKTWRYPTFLKGPCSLLLYFAGTIATTGMGTLVFAHVPDSWIPTS